MLQIDSMMTTPPTSFAACKPSAEMTGMIEFLGACRKTTVRSSGPFAIGANANTSDGAPNYRMLSSGCSNKPTVSSSGGAYTQRCAGSISTSVAIQNDGIATARIANNRTR